MTPIESFIETMNENPDMLDLQVEPEPVVYGITARMWDRKYKYPIIIRTKIDRNFIETATTFEAMEVFFAIAEAATEDNPPSRSYKPSANRVDRVEWVDD